MAKTNGVKKHFHKDVKTRAAELIEELDHLATQFREVALVTKYDCVFSWHKYKLENLTGAIERTGEPLGFVCASEVDNRIHVKFWLLPKHENGPDRSDIQEELLHAFHNEVSENFECGPDNRDSDEINRKFEFPAPCPTCGQVKAA